VCAFIYDGKDECDSNANDDNEEAYDDDENDNDDEENDNDGGECEAILNLNTVVQTYI
jgi:hypothetical protein